MAEWNPEKDLLAMVTDDSKVLLHRFNWQRLWTISPGWYTPTPLPSDAHCFTHFECSLSYNQYVQSVNLSVPLIYTFLLSSYSDL